MILLEKKELDEMIWKFPSWIWIVGIGVAAIIVAALIIFLGP